ncbi:LIA1, partial [Symbiodinium necroappetens]
MNFIAGVMLCVFRSGGNSDTASDSSVTPARAVLNFQAAEPIAYHCVLSMLLRHGMNQYFGDGFPKLRLSALQFDCLLE